MVVRGVEGTGSFGLSPIGTLAARVKLPALATSDVAHQRSIWPAPQPNLAFNAGREAPQRMPAQRRAQRVDAERVANEAA
jgi:hypothetical protein